MTEYIFYYSTQFCNKTTAVLLTPLDLPLHIFSLNIKCSNLIAINIAVEKVGDVMEDICSN